MEDINQECFQVHIREEVMRDKILVRERPTAGEMDIINSVKGIMLSFMHKPDSVKDGATAKAFLDGWLAGLGLKPSHRLALVVIPKETDLETYKERYIEELIKSGDKYPRFVVQIINGVDYEE